MNTDGHGCGRRWSARGALSVSTSPRRWAKSFGALVLVMLASGLPAFAASYAKKEKPAPGEEIFDNKTVLTIRIDITNSELVTLRQNDRKDVRATVYEGSRVWRDVAVHVKG